MFKDDMFNELYKKTMKAGAYSLKAGDMWEPEVRAQHFVDLANAKLKEMMEAAPTIYCSDIENECWGKTPTNTDTHSAKLMFIEPIERKQSEEFIDAGFVVNGEILYKKVVK
jgi:hypothetical protein